jgi:anaerobic dimethyl sulfoxide reductase subunit A
MSVADAKARGIKDGDQVRVHSSVGEMIIPAYVTSRIIPGVAAVYHGGFYAPSATKTDLMPDGIDRAGDQNFLIEDNQPGKMIIGPTLDAGLCQVEKL